MKSVLYLLPALAASLAFYLACAHQRFAPGAIVTTVASGLDRMI